VAAGAGMADGGVTDTWCGCDDGFGGGGGGPWTGLGFLGWLAGREGAISGGSGGTGGGVAICRCGASEGGTCWA
jgi:hypothetical protein